MLSSFTCKALLVRGYSSRPIHPKHLFGEERNDILCQFLKFGTPYFDVGCGVGTECISAMKESTICSCGVDCAWPNLTTSRQRNLLDYVQSLF